VARIIVDSYVAKAFEEEGGKIEYVLGQPANNMAKLNAARGQEPPFDLFETMDNFPAAARRRQLHRATRPDAGAQTSGSSTSEYDSGKVIIWITQEASSTIKRSSPRPAIPAPKRLPRPRGFRASRARCRSPTISAGGAIPRSSAFLRGRRQRGPTSGRGSILVKEDRAGQLLVIVLQPADDARQRRRLGGAAQAGNVQRLRGKVDLAIVFHL